MIKSHRNVTCFLLNYKYIDFNEMNESNAGSCDQDGPITEEHGYRVVINVNTWTSQIDNCLIIFIYCHL